jgi:hypothetical protein
VLAERTIVVKLLKKMLVSGDHIASDTGQRWSVLWDTTLRPEGRWSTAEAKTEAEALERAAHFRKLGFAVHAINDPSGVMVMDAAAVEARLLQVSDEPPRRVPERSPPSTEQSCLHLLRRVVQQHDAGQTLTTASVRTRLLVQGMTGSEFERVLSFAKGQGWLEIADGTLTLTQMGYAAAIA